MGAEGNSIPLLISYLTESGFYSRDALRYSLEILCNLCLHHSNRKTICDHGGVEAAVSLHIDEDEHIRRLSVQVVEYLGDLTPAEVLARQKTDIGLERMVSLASNQDPLVRAVAAESIGEEVWMDIRKQGQAQKIGAIDALLAIANNKGEAVESLVPALYSLRNIMHSNPDGQAQFGYRDGLLVVSNVLKRALSGLYQQHSADVFEAALTCLVSACLKEEKNSRRLLMVGLDPLLDLAEGSISTSKLDFVNVEDKKALSSQSVGHLKAAMQNEGVIALAKSILLMLAPYNYVVCRNCQKKQELRGTSCYSCGNRLLVDVDYKKDTYLPKKNAKSLPASAGGPLPSSATVGGDSVSRATASTGNEVSIDNDALSKGRVKKAMTHVPSSDFDAKKQLLSQTAPPQFQNHKKS